MRLLILSQYFWPEQFIINDLVKCLASQGHTLVVLTGKPNYPDGEFYPGYSGPGIQREWFNKSTIEIVRVPMRARRSGGARNLLLNYLSFVWSGLRYFPRLMQGRKFDAIVVFAISPITAVIPAIRLKFVCKAHLAVWIQDLWPESLSATGFIRNPWLLRLVGGMVRAIYAGADTLLIQSQAFHAPVARYADPKKIAYYPNSIDTAPISEASGLLPDYLIQILQTNFCAVFAGNIGRAQSVETLIAAAHALKNIPDCKIIVVGSGGMVEWVKQQQVVGGLDNLVLPGRFPMSMMPQLYYLAGALLVTLKDEEIFSYTVPSKIQAYLAAGKPIVAALNGEGARVVAEAGAGLTCAAEDSAALAQCIRDLRAMPEAEREQLGANGRAYFLKHFEMSGQAKRLIEILEARIGMRRKG